MMNPVKLCVFGLGIALSPRLLAFVLAPSLSEPESLSIFGGALFAVAVLARREMFGLADVTRVWLRLRRQPEPVL